MSAELERRYCQVEGWLYGGDRDTEINYRSCKAVKIRRSQRCSGAYHDEDSRNFPPGTVMIVERALVDGQWCSCYTCENCIKQSELELSR
jgi:hypothetical protein